MEGRAQEAALGPEADVALSEDLPAQIALRPSPCARDGFQHAWGRALADQLRRRPDRAFRTRLALQDAALPSDARATRSRAKHEPQGQLLRQRGD